MGRVVVELTNRCNLSCQYCFTGRHGGSDDLSLDILRRVLDEAKANGFDHLAFTGGDPTVHPEFTEALRLTHDAGYDFSFVTNGWNFANIYQRILPYRDRLAGIAFSIDGATENSHDKLRGKGSFRRLLKSVSVCVVEGLPFTLNMVVTAHNSDQVEEMADMASRLGSYGLRFIHLMPTLLTTLQKLDLSPEQRKEVESRITALRPQYTMPISMAAGFHTEDLFPCSPLKLKEVNVDCKGNFTACCQLSGHGDGAGQGDVIGDLNEISFTEAFTLLTRQNERFLQEKRERFGRGDFIDSDYFPCWYCSVYYRKVEWLKGFKGHSWSGLIRENSAEVKTP